MLTKTAQQALGSSLPGLIKTTGDIGVDIYNQTGEIRPDLAIPAGVLSGALDIIPGMQYLKQLGGPKVIGQIESSLIKRMGVEGAKSFLKEGGTEVLQTGIESGAIVVAGGEAKGIDEYIDSAIQGGFSGAATGAGIEAFNSFKNRNNTQPVNLPTENEVLNPVSDEITPTNEVFTENDPPDNVDQATWEDSPEGQISQAMHEEITPLVQEFNTTTDPVIKKSLTNQIEKINTQLAEVEQQYIEKNKETDIRSLQNIENDYRKAKTTEEKDKFLKEWEDKAQYNYGNSQENYHRMPSIKRIISENVVAKRVTGYNPNTQVKTIDGEVSPKPKQILAKKQLKEILNALGQDSIDVVVQEATDGKKGEKSILYKDNDGELEINLSAFGLLNNDNIKIGDTVSISLEDLNSKGLAKDNALRIVDEDNNILASKKNNKPRLIKDNLIKGPQKIDNFEKLEIKPTDNKPINLKLHSSVSNLINKYAVRIAEGNLKRGTKGTFNNKTHTIRISGMNNVSVAIHEITHGLDLFNNIVGSLMDIKSYSVVGSPIYSPGTYALRKELSKVYLDNYVDAQDTHSLKLRLTEGYATLLQRYIEAPTYTKENYPLSVKEFLTPGGEFYKPVIGEIIADAKNIVKEYQSLTANKKIGAFITRDNLVTGKKELLNTYDKIVTIIADQVFPIKKLAEIAGAKGINDPSLIIRYLANVSHYVANNVIGKKGYWSYKNGSIVKKLDFNWGTLIKSLEKSGNSEEFDNHLISRRTYYMNEELKELKADLFRKNEYAKVIAQENKDGLYNTIYGEDKNIELKEAESKYNDLKSILDNNGQSEIVASEAYLTNRDKYKKEEDMFDTLNKKDLELMNDNDIGLLTDEDFKRLSNIKGYASFKRQFYSEIAGDEAPKKAGGVAGKISSLLKMKGSDRIILSPLQSAIKSHSEIFSKSMKQLVYNKMVLLTQSGKVDNFMDIVDLRPSFDSDGKINGYPQEKSDKYIVGRINKKRVVVEVDTTIKNVLSNVLDFESLEYFENFLIGSNKMFTKSTSIIYPYFSVTNFIADQVGAVSTTKHNFTPFYSPIKDFYKGVLKKDPANAEYYNEYLTLVGHRFNISNLKDMSANEMSEYLTKERKGIYKALDAVNLGVDILSAPGQYSETITRASEYVAARKNGQDQVEAMNRASELTGTFSRIGNWGGKAGRAFIRSMPYANVPFQILSKNAEQIRRGEALRPIIVTAAVAAVQVAGMAATISFMFGDDDQREAMKDLGGTDLANNIYYPDSDGHTLNKIKIPNNLSLIGTMMSMMIANKYLNTNYSYNDYIDGLTSWIPSQMNIFKHKEAVASLLPTLIKAPIQVIYNSKDYPRIQPLEGKGQQTKPKEERYTESTPELTKTAGRWTGKHLGLSPIQLDALIIGYLGRTTNFITKKPGIYDPLTNPSKLFESKSYFQSGRRMQKYYEIKTSVQEDYSFQKISDKVKAGTQLTPSESKIRDMYREIHGYVPNEVPGIKEERVKGIDDLIEEYKVAFDAKDILKANTLIKDITKKTEKIQNYE